MFVYSIINKHTSFIQCIQVTSVKVTYLAEKVQLCFQLMACKSYLMDEDLSLLLSCFCERIDYINPYMYFYYLKEIKLTSLYTINILLAIHI